MASSCIGESRAVLVVGIRNTYCECDIRARIMISKSERNQNRLYATCAKYPKFNYYVWLTPRRVGDCEPSNQDTNNSEQSPIDNVDFVMLEARFVVVCSLVISVQQVLCTICELNADPSEACSFNPGVMECSLHLEPPNYYDHEVEDKMMNHLLVLHLQPPFLVQQRLPFPVQVSFSVPWSNVSQSIDDVYK
ncbi:uncharacterized protein G2W53_028747 [Senna tora]|uniref:Uncharacterized protein n=1 Tax=Senna tora TaxID=362788 RepID=A0A834T1J7_9FABA|nr:uncharacterized protein G2W53_028747 [Senna tora]